MQAIVLTCGNSSRLEATPHGAHITSWQVDGQEQLYLSPLCNIESGKAIRGGIPVIFPQFETFGDGPRHGFARTAMWLADTTDNTLRFSLPESEKYSDKWPFKAEVHYQARLEARSLHLTLSVKNNHSQNFAFTCALHTYFQVDDLSRTRLSGLQNLSYWDNGTDFSKRATFTESEFGINGKTDRIFFDSPAAINLNDGKRRLTLESTGFEDTVVWNPGKEDAKNLADLPDAGYQQMLCIEPARVQHPIELAPGEQWTGTHKITVE